MVSGPWDRPPEQEHTWPVQVFDDAACAYETATRTFVLRSASRAPLLNPEQEGLRQRQEAPEQVARRDLRRQQRALALHRGQRIEQRKQADAAWRVLCQARSRSPLSLDAGTLGRLSGGRGPLAGAPRAPSGGAGVAAEEDVQDRAKRQRLREHLSQLPSQNCWSAILVLTDNCTRQCLGLPLFVAGAKVTADLVIAALRALLPADLQCLISGRGVHFTAHQFARFAKELDFIHVLVARHRPESNGITAANHKPLDSPSQN